MTLPKGQPVHRVVRSIAGASAAFAFLGHASVGWSQPNASFSFFAGLSPSMYSDVQGKLTYVGRQFRLKPTIAFAVTGTNPDLSLYRSYRYPSIRYANDDFAQNIRRVRISPAGIDSMLSRLSLLPSVTDGGLDAGHILSFSLCFAGPDTTQVFDTILDADNATALVGALRLAWDDQPEAIGPLTAFGCGAGLLSGTPPAERTSSAKVTVGELRPQPEAGLYVGTISIKNTSDSTFAAPVSLVVNTGSGAMRLDNATGRTCLIAPSGLDYINLPGSLAPNATVSVTVTYRNRARTDSPASTRVFAGPGER